MIKSVSKSIFKRLPDEYSRKLKHRYKKSISAGLYLRGTLEKFRKSKQNVNIYHATIQKTGSQWVKAILSDPDIVEKTGLYTYPQFRYEAGDFVNKFPYYTFVPGLYISYPLYNEINKPLNYKTLYVIRDPRDVVVSWYYSMKYTHPSIGTVPKHREKLNSLDEASGLCYCIRQLQLKFSYMRSWWYNRDDKNVYTARFEELTERPLKEWKKIFKHFRVNISNQELEKVLNRYTKEKMRKRDLKVRSSNRSHYRKDKKEWVDLADERHNKLFSKVNGNIIDCLGYK